MSVFVLQTPENKIIGIYSDKKSAHASASQDYKFGPEEYIIWQYRVNYPELKTQVYPSSMETNEANIPEAAEEEGYDIKEDYDDESSWQNYNLYDGDYSSDDDEVYDDLD